jgi:hypothetical protein
MVCGKMILLFSGEFKRWSLFFREEPFLRRFEGAFQLFSLDGLHFEAFFAERKMDFCHILVIIREPKLF